MLTLEPPYYEFNSILVYRDHAVATQFYYAAPQPKITRSSGRLMFDLFMYSVALEHSPLAGTTIPDELGAGFLTMGVDCALDDSRRSNLLRDLADRTGLAEDTLSLYPIPYHKGTVRVLALDKFAAPAEPAADPASPEPLKGRPTFVEEILGGAKPSLLGDLRAIFSLKLSQEGAVFLEGLYKDKAAPVGVVYELNFYGMRPAVEARITANLDRIYKYFGGGLQGQYGWAAIDIEAGLRFLEEHSEIKVEITSQAVGDEAQKSKDLALSLFRDRIVQELFRPTTPSPQQTASSAASSMGALTGTAQNMTNAAANMRITLRARAEITQELKTVVYDFRERSPEERFHAPQSFLPVLLSPQELDRRIHRIDLNSDFFELLEVLVSGPSPEEFQALGIREVKIDLTYGQPGDSLPPESETLLFRPESSGDKNFAVKRRGRKSLAYSYVLTYEFLKRSATDSDTFRYELAPRVATSRTLRINPNVDFGALNVELEPGQIYPDIQEVDIDLAYTSPEAQFQATDHFRLNVATPEKHRWQVRTLETALSPYTAQYAFKFKDNAVYKAPAQQFTDQLLTVDSPFQQERVLLVRPNVVSTAITDIDLEIEYEDAEHNYRRRFMKTLQTPFGSQEMRWPILDANHQEIRFRVTAHEPGFITEGEWEKTSDPSIVIGSKGSRAAVVKIQLVGPALSAVGIDAVQFLVEPIVADGTGVETQSFLLEGSEIAHEVRLIIPPGGSLRYRYQTKTFKSDGSVVDTDWKESTTTLLAISTRSF